MWKAWQLAPKPEKCVDLAKSGGLLGVELINGLSLAPKFKRLGSIVSSLVALLGSKRGSPQNVHSFLGTVQWTCLLNRPLLSSLSRVYEFVERMPFARPQHVPREVLDEFSVWFALMSYLNVDLARPWSASLVATDGAQSFGFGMAQAPCRPEWVRHVAAHCAVDGHGIIPDGVDLDTKSIQAVTSPLHVPVSYDAFVPKLSVKAKGSDDAPTLEAVACTLATRRLTRALKNHGTRSVMLLDAQALIGALRKGRSSSGAFKLQLQKIAALNLCADISVTYGYIPTSCNPSDPPSRGLKRNLKHHSKTAGRCGKHRDSAQERRRVIRHLRASPRCGLPEHIRMKSGYDSCSSGSMTAQPCGNPTGFSELVGSSVF